VNKDLTALAPHEELWLWQLAQGFTNAEAAKAIKVSERHYWKLVNGLLNPDSYEVDPTPGQLCALARRRYGRGLAGTARLAKCSPPTLLKRERTGDPKIIAFWEKKGFTFRHG
jgi:hypothetical protein